MWRQGRARARTDAEAQAKGKEKFEAALALAEKTRAEVLAHKEVRSPAPDSQIINITAAVLFNPNLDNTLKGRSAKASAEAEEKRKAAAEAVKKKRKAAVSAYSKRHAYSSQ